MGEMQSTDRGSPDVEPTAPAVSAPTDKVLIGVTGGIATGKSTVLTMLHELGAETIDADVVYHELIAPGGTLVEPLLAQFGPEIQSVDGSIDRRALGRIVFRDPRAMAALERITHPVITAEITRRIRASHSPVIAIDAVKLIESGTADMCDAVWLVVADPAIQRARLIARNGIDAEEANRRLAAQPEESARRARADTIIDNSGTEEHLRQTVIAAWNLVPKLTF